MTLNRVARWPAGQLDQRLGLGIGIAGCDIASYIGVENAPVVQRTATLPGAPLSVTLRACTVAEHSVTAVARVATAQIGGRPSNILFSSRKAYSARG